VGERQKLHDAFRGSRAQSATERLTAEMDTDTVGLSILKDIFKQSAW